MSEYLDPVAFPFTAPELSAAIALLVPGPEGVSLLATLLEQIEIARASRDSAFAARARGSTDPEEINEWTVMLPDELYAALCLAAPACAPRVEALLAEWRAMARQASQWAAMRQAGLHPLASPTPSVLALLAEEEATARAAWESAKARVAAMHGGTDSGNPLPSP